ncbi:hypothetical protein HUB98_16365 [Paenibacillus barcinonensis]|uniref:50S ribosome-binding GTPase n=2 Tax=Paenibacillus barcinonensis TaxID=198119 RepID=A0ABX6Q681_PAEBA|nr:hypothetical protein [Paenibacillus barcinonensis]QKS57718.1 hypothetical protein HUB98_16365 [Paenibacillus barcinonensis]
MFAAFLRPENNVKGAKTIQMMNLRAYGYMSGVGKSSLLNALMEQESRFVQHRTSYLIDKGATDKTNAMWNKQKKKNGGWKK